MVYDLLRGTTVMFGGRGGTELADTWEWNGTNWTPRTTANSPPARSSHALAHDLGRSVVVLFGGTTAVGTAAADLDDTWEYDGTDWTQRLPAHRPLPRRDARMATDVPRSRVVLFGGGAGPSGQPLFADTWEWNGIDWAQRNPLNSPPARWAHAMTYDFVHTTIVLFGGAGNAFSPLGDTWTWNGIDWAPVQTLLSPPPSTDTAIAFDVWSALVVQFGGYPNGGETWLFDGASWRRDPRAVAPSPRATFTLAHDLLRGKTVMFGGRAGSFLGDTWEYAAGVVARWTPFGVGCAGTAGVPLLRQDSGSLPVLGGTFALELFGVPANGIAALAIGFSDQQWSTHALPWQLGPLGMPGCTAYASVEFLLFTSATLGRATFSLPLPNDPGLVGRRFFEQALVVSPGVNAFGAVVSNAGAGVLGLF